MRRVIVLVSIFSFLFASNLDLMNALCAQTLTGKEVYKIEPGDVLEIEIYGEEELSRTLMVMHNGAISFPLVGEVKVAGLSTDDASVLLTSALRKYFTHPVVSIILKSPSVPYVSVFGEVFRQGAVEYQRGLRVSDYVALAGGPTPNAKLGSVRVVRWQPVEPTLMVVETVNLDDILRRGAMAKNYELKSGDWVYIPKKFTINWGIVFSALTLAVTVANLYITIDRLGE
ncbi:MAG: polysaccharide biosynthesis/export family protein [candidate division WOR-3 bacterium]|nr:MAG: polysaccharide biosynthesis/export family protein [candidate division WOR-3 bacterium]